MIAIVDYGLGNIRAFAEVYKRLDLTCVIARSAADLAHADRFILPGVGAFDEAMTLLNRSGMREVLEQKVIRDRVPVLGVCVGMQILARSSEEGILPGLDWIPGVVKQLRVGSEEHTAGLPHMGWNEVTPARRVGLFTEVGEHARFYFLHSFGFHCDTSDSVLATTDYGSPFASAVARENILGVQFHPEKSHQNGLRVLKNFGIM